MVAGRNGKGKGTSRESTSRNRNNGHIGRRIRKYIEDTPKRRVIFSKRKKVIMKLLADLSTLTGCKYFVTIENSSGKRFERTNMD